MVFENDYKKENFFQILLVFLKITQSDTFSLYACLVASIPMVSFVFGLVIILVSVQIMFQYHKISLPNVIGAKTFSKKQLEYILNKYAAHLIKIEKYLKMRWVFLTSTIGQIILGIVCLMHGILIVLPIPLGNFLPGIALVFLALGVIEKDGLFIVIGYFLSIGIFLFFFKSSIFIYKAIEYFYNLFCNFM